MTMTGEEEILRWAQDDRAKTLLVMVCRHR